MKKITGLVVAVFAIVLAGVTWAQIVSAQSFSPRIARGDIVDNSIYAASQEVIIDGTVNGDVHCVGQTIKINGTVNGDVLCAGQQIAIDGTVNGSIRVAAQRVHINGTVSRGVTIAGEQVTIARDARLGRDVTIAGSKTIIEGTIARDAVVASSDTQIDSKIGRNLRHDGAKLQLQNAAYIGGSLTYTSNQAVDKDSDSQIIGSTTHHTPQKSKMPWGISVVEAVTMFMALLLFSMALVLFAPKMVHQTSQVAVSSLGLSILIGFAAMFAFPAAIGLLMATVIGVPLAITIGLLGLVLIFISGPIAGYYLGSMLLSKSHNPIHIMLLGSAVLLILYMVPVIGILVMFAAYLIGSGAILITIKRTMPKPVYKVK